MVFRLLVPVALLLALAACRGHPAHPVLRAARDAPSTEPVEPRPPEPEPPDGAQARALLFLGIDDAEGPLRLLKQRPTPIGSPPQLVLLPRMEQAVVRRYGMNGPGGPVRSAAALGFSAVFPLRPRAVADLWLDPAVGKDAIWADRLDHVRTEFDVEGCSRHLYWCEMLRRGQGPVRFDFRFAARTERWDLPDGSIVMRHDPVLDPRPQHVTLYRGATWIEPHPNGALVTEFLVMGTDITVPFFLQGALRKSSIDLLRHRATFLYERAAERAR